MAKLRLSELYPLQSHVEILLNGIWQAGIVASHQHPAIWVVDEEGHAWFVTNRQRIRPYTPQPMKPEVAQQLIDLNRDFYDHLADPFARSRVAPQPGFAHLLDWLPQPCQRVLDVGCGNGRFGHFLQQQGVSVEYVGVDFSPPLLDKAQAQHPPGEFYARDLSQPDCLAGLGQFDLVVCLAVMQHIPGQANRQRLLGEMGQRLAENGRIFLANWQFMDSPRQRRKRQDWSEIGLSSGDVEANDHLLNWQRGGYGLRYVCQIDAAETAVLAHATQLHTLHQFRSDGKEGNLSLYTILAHLESSAANAKI